MTDLDSKPQGAAAPADSAEALNERFRTEQNFPLAVAVGAVAAVAGAVIWAWVTIYTKSKLGILTFALGAVTGKAVGIAGKGIDRRFGILGASCALAGVILGDILIQAMIQAGHSNVLEFLTPDNLPRLVDSFFNGFQPMDLLFYGFAIYFGYRYSFRFGLPKRRTSF